MTGPAPLGPIRPATVSTAGDAPQLAEPVSQEVRVLARDVLKGHVDIEELAGGWVRPWRFLVSQRRALESCMAWYPGIFRQMADCTAGVRLAFETDSTSVTLEVRVDEEPRATRNVLVNVDGRGGAELPHDGISVDVDGDHLPAAMPAPGETRMTFDLAAAAQPSRADLMPLPGMGPTHRVRIWLPCLRGCEVGQVLGDGTFLRPLSDDAPGMLVLGDSVSQGFTTGDAALAWPSVVASRLGLSLTNQAVGAQVFQPTSLVGLAAWAQEKGMPWGLVIVALGGNYRYGRCSERVVGREILEFLTLASELAPAAPLVVMPPYVRGREAVRGSCYGEVPRLVGEAAVRVRERRSREGSGPVLLLEAPDIPAKLLTDEDGHPDEKGAARVARHVLEGLKQLDCRCLRETGAFGRCGACRKRV